MVSARALCMLTSRTMPLVLHVTCVCFYFIFFYIYIIYIQSYSVLDWLGWRSTTSESIILMFVILWNLWGIIKVGDCSLDLRQATIIHYLKPSLSLSRSLCLLNFLWPGQYWIVAYAILYWSHSPFKYHLNFLTMPSQEKLLNSEQCHLKSLYEVVKAEFVLRNHLTFATLSQSVVV